LEEALSPTGDAEDGHQEALLVAPESIRGFVEVLARILVARAVHDQMAKDAPPGE